MLRRISAKFPVLVMLVLVAAASASAATLGSSLRAKLDGLAADAQVGTVIISFNTARGLQFGRNVVQNLQILTDAETVAGFTALQTVENLPNTDLNVGHGTRCAGIIDGG